MNELRFVGRSEFDRILSLDDAAVRARAFASACRINTLSMIAEAGSGHVGTSFSCMDILSWLHLEVLGPNDRYFSSKGHDAPGLYAVLIGLGRLEFDLVHRLRRLGGLPGHPDLLATPAVVTNTGSLGMGVSKARGFVLADRLAGRSGRVFVLTGDGELQEGQFWESLQPTANRALDEITVIVDHNKIQSDTWVETVSDLGSLEDKVRAFGWRVGRCDGNDVASFSTALDELLAQQGPRLLVADTRKGAGVSFMEPADLPLADTALYPFHSGAPDAKDYERALAELHRRLEELLERSVELEQAPAPVRSVQTAAAQRLVRAWSDAICALAEEDPRLVALDGDLRLDTGLVDFQRRFPDRFFECGIAEQDMVSQAGAMALGGLLPVVHSFASFLTPRGSEQIFNNATEGTKVVYHGSLAGIVPGGPGHSHQSVRDIALMGSVPGMAALEPYCEQEVALALEWAVREAQGPVYVRLVSRPWELGFAPPAASRLEPGRGTLLREGTDGTFVCTGPVLVSQAWQAAEVLGVEGLSFGVIALPWLRGVDGAWLAEVASEGPIVCVDNHVLSGGQGDEVLGALAAAAPGAAARVVKHGVTGVPVCGSDDEVLRTHRLDAAGLVTLVRAVAHANVSLR